MVLPPRLRSVGHKLKTGHFRDALHDLQPVYNPERDLDRLLMADIQFHTGQWNDAEALASGLTSTPAVPAGIQGRAYELLTWLIKYKDGVPSAVSFAERALQQAEKAHDLMQICRAQLALLVAKADAYGPASLGTLPDDAQRNVMRSGDARLMSWLHIRLAEVEARRGRFDLTTRHLDLASNQSQQNGEDDLLATVQTHLLRGVVATFALHPERSMDHNRDALRSAREAGYHFGEVAALLNLGHLSLSMERFDDARGYLDSAEPLLGDRLPLAIGWTDTRAQLALALGDLDECERLIERLAMLSNVDRTPKPSYSSLEAALTSARLKRQLGDPAGALALLDNGAIEARTRRSPLLEATFQIHRADLLLDTGRLREALAALREASRQSLGSFVALLAEAEQIRARASSALGFPLLAEARRDRASRILTAIGRPAARVAEPAPAMAMAARSEPASEAAVAPAAREECLLMLETAASLMELGGRPDLLAQEVFALCRRAMAEGPLALVRREGDVRELRASVEWPNLDFLSLDSNASLDTKDGVNNVMRLTIEPEGHGVAYEILADIAMHRAAQPMLDALQAIVNAASRLNTPADEIRGPLASLATLATSSSAAAAAAAASTVLVLAPPLAAASSALFAGQTTKDLLRQAHRIGRTDLTVLITGETGVGKEIFAHEIRRVSPRQWSRYSRMVCASIPRELLENGLGVANAGTVLLDEISELSPEKQVALLRLMDEREAQAAAQAASADGPATNVRFLFTTNANLDQLVQERRFREDLFHRINVVVLRIPPLRERRDEILPLARHFLSLFASRHRRIAPALTDEAAEALLLHAWPGNVRELRNEMERIVGLLDPDALLIPAGALSDSVRAGRAAATPFASTVVGPHEVLIRADQPLRVALDELEREIIARRLRESHGNLDRIAAGLGLSRKGLYFKRQRHGLL